MDLGCGTGILGVYLLKNNVCRKAVFVDIVENALTNTIYNLRINNVFYKSIVVGGENPSIYFRNHVFDLIVANPPYLPGLPIDQYDYSLLGGLRGYETILSFIRDAYKLLKHDGIFYVVYSTLSNPEVVEKELTKYFKISKRYTRKFFYETIYVVRAEK